ncbi:hypothetical protein GV794_24295 [Nocardia cyriacigeorgica]|uniref:Uncharacterized protein n=1 Tax=Nocardia cyriacigeorgica TaxID=135487 RepID=A0A6P1D9C9_9NOCA|nr:hypothetical protein [Nocardia cyriacigeorgica]NEW39687.1 hypothetical protein [Nocardia cyriacigeorgica]NEW46259.1 hypothetical protein [Nocardia cyriacigeorgica]NEW50177.1 hypothetical protein [Nocardia cyriacigeorgica]NEW58735.1 hypothetical protein [Nocardia cyriacigeorgica]
MFDWYVGLLALSGSIMIVMAVVKGGQSEAFRWLNGALGAGFLAYAGYLAFLFEGGSYLILFHAFILPVMMVVNFVRSTDWTALTTKPTPTQQAWRAYQKEQERLAKLG